MKNRKELTVSDIIWLVSKITYILGNSMTTEQGKLYSWDIWDNKKYAGEIILDAEKKEIQIIDCFLDLKTNYALEGLASITGLKVEDYFTN